MIETIFIPTYGRVDKQVTYDHLPKKWQKRSILLTNAEETKILSDRGYPAQFCEAQGHIGAVRQWIKDNAKGKYAVFDDDLIEFVYTARPSERSKYRLVNTPINGPRLEPGFEDHFDRMMDEMSAHLDDVVACCAQTTWIPPFEEDYKEPFRMSGNHFFNADTLPKDIVNFQVSGCAEDFYYVLQLCTNGYPVRVHQRWRVRPANTAEAGGCDTYRTIDIHNEAMEQLARDYPEYVRLKEKVAKVGEWGGKPKLAANIQWKKALKDGMSKVPDDNSLDELFG